MHLYSDLGESCPGILGGWIEVEFADFKKLWVRNKFWVPEKKSKSARTSDFDFDGLVLVCMSSYDSESRLIFQHFSRSTRLAFLCTAQTPKIQFLISTIFEKLKIEISIEISKFGN